MGGVSEVRENAGFSSEEPTVYALLINVAILNSIIGNWNK